MAKARTIKTAAPALEVVKDPGRYAAVNLSGTRVYHGSEGLPLEDAVRVAEGVVAATGIARVEHDGSLTPGRVTRVANGRLVFAV